MPKTPCVLIVDDSADDAELIVWELRRHGYEPVWESVADAQGMSAALASRTWDIVLCDYNIPGFGALEALRVLQETGQDVPLVIVSGALGEETAVEAMKAGAADFVLKNRLGRLGPILKRELSELAVRRRLARTQIQWTAAFDSVSDAIFIHDGAYRILRVNRAYAQLAQAPAKAILGRPYWDVFPRRDGPLLGCSNAAGGHGAHNEEEVALATGQTFLSRHFPVTDERGQTSYYLHVMQDITERKSAERRIARLKRLYETRSQTSRLIVGASDEQALFSAVCAIAVDQGGMIGAVVRVADQKALVLRPVAYTPSMRKVVEQVRMSIDPAQVLFPAATAYLENRVFTHNDLAADPGRFPIPVAAGIRSMAVMPLRRRGRPAGTLSLYAGEPHYIDEEMARLLNEMATDISFALDNFDRVREQQLAQAALRQAEELFRQLAGNIPEAFWVREADSNTMLYVSPGWEIITGRPAPANWQDVLRVLHAGDHEGAAVDARQFDHDGEDRERRIVRPDGSTRWVHVRSFPIRNESGAVYRVAGMAEDVTERRAAEQRLLEMAHYDTLTALPNRKLFFDSLHRSLQQAEQNLWTVAVMFIDLDRFKVVNDTLGHATGDALLQQVASRLLGCVRIRDIVGRLGGDEFAMILPALDSTEDAGLIAGKIVEAFSDPFELDGREVFITASLGITVFPFDARDATTLMRYADTAMYRAKEEGRNIFRYYTSAMNERALEKMELENQLRRARERGEFMLHYQPKVDLRTGRICGVEALLRWRRPGGELPPPMDYIPLLEETGLIVPVGEWVIFEACRQIRAWEQQGVVVPVAVNLSARQFHDKKLATVIARAVEQSGIRAELLECEITESSLMLDAAETIRILRALRAAGSTLSIDDFGTGYSSLGYLKRFPIHAVKIDRSFVSDIMTSAEDAALAKGIIGMAHSLNLKVIAEGVETMDQCEFLRRNGCAQGQGFYFSEPAEAEEITRQLRLRPALRRGTAARSPGTATPEIAGRSGRTRH